MRVPDGRPVRVLAPEGNLTALCCSVEECIVEAPRALLAWKAFFDYARTADVPAQDDALALLWEAHIHSLHEASPLAAPLLQELPCGRRGRPRWTGWWSAATCSRPGAPRRCSPRACPVPRSWPPRGRPYA